jgi:hypothetical protein
MYMFLRTPCHKENHISGVMVSVLASSAVNSTFKTCRVTTKIIKLIFVVSLLSMQH